jgi:hypothetical protein
MPSLDDLGHDEFELLARIAHRYYADGQTQEALAREYGLTGPGRRASSTSGSRHRRGSASTWSTSSASGSVSRR